MKTMELNTILIPSQRDFDRSVLISKKISKQYEAYYQLEDNKDYSYAPHISIYFGIFPIDALEDIIKILEIITSKVSQINLKFSSLHQEAGWVGATFTPSKELAQLHRQIVEELSPLRDKTHSSAEPQPSHTPTEAAYIKQYGRARLFELYTPHLTFTRLKDPTKGSSAIQDIEWASKGISLNKVVLAESQVHGSIKRGVHALKLKGDTRETATR